MTSGNLREGSPPFPRRSTRHRSSTPHCFAAVGDEIPPLTRKVSRTTVFIFNAAYYGTHRFHYDVEAARAEGFADVVVTANLICSYFEQAVRGLTGDARYLRALEERSITPTVAGATLTIEGAVTEVERRADGTRFVC